MQQQPPSAPPIPQNHPAKITTEQIQKFLDENKQLILAILENQNLGKLAECAQYQALLQKNLLFLAAIADAQPQAPTMRPQMTPTAAMQQGGHYMQHTPMFPPRPSFNPQQLQDQQQQQHQLYQQPQLMPFHGSIGMRPGLMNGTHTMHAEASHGGSSGLLPGSSMIEFPRGGTASSSVDGRGTKQDVAAATSESVAAAADGNRSSVTGRESADAESSRSK